MRNQDPKDIVRQLEALVGKRAARRLMVVEGLSPSTADKLLRECYPSEVGALLGDALERALNAAKKARAS